MDCITEKTALAFVHGKVRPPASGEIESHLNVCPACRRMAAEAAIAAFEDSPPVANFDLQASITFLPGSTGSHSSGILIPGTQVGRYQIVDLIGAGATATVYRAYDPRLRRHIALKLIRTTYSSASTVDEAEAMARLSHPHVVGIHDAGMIDEHAFVVMELVEGTTLAAWLRERPRSWREVLAVFLDAGSGLAAAHAANLVHGDFKPDNILVTAGGRAKVSDFGLAGAPAPVPDGASPSAQARAHLSGTPAYMAPELFAGQPPSQLADQFSYCVSLYSSLYEQHPFFARNAPPRTVPEFMSALTDGHITEPPPSMDAPPWLFPVIARGLEKRPKDRFASMQGLIAEIERHLAEPPAAPAAIEPVAAVRKTVVFIIAAAACVLLAAGVAVLWNARHATQPTMVVAICGNGVREGSEQCDDGNRSDDDGCLATCRSSACGDGHVRAGVEECDSGKLGGDADCNAGCMRCSAQSGQVAVVSGGGSHCYARQDTPLDWNAAVEACDKTGGHLAVPKETYAHQSILKLLTGRPGPYWIGMRAPEPMEIFTWARGESPGDFLSGWVTTSRPPANHCLTIASSDAFAWSPCKTPLPFACERGAWITNPGDNHAYQALRMEKTWEGARRLCEARGAHLVTIGGEAERRFLNDHFLGTLWIGGFRAANQFSYRWLDDTRVASDLFATGEPDLPKRLDGCLALNDNKIRDRSCDGMQRGPYAVLCEVD